MILEEICDVDKKSFTFRYPSSLNKLNEMQQFHQGGWEIDDEKVHSITGLPKEHGIMFEHFKSFCIIHEFVSELKKIIKYHEGCWDYISENYEEQLWDYYQEYLHSIDEINDPFG